MKKRCFAKTFAILTMTALVGAACRKQESGTTPGGEQSEIENVSADSLKAVFAEPVNRTAFVGPVYSWMTDDRIRVAAAEEGTIDFKYSGMPSAGEVTFVKNESTAKTVLFGAEGFAIYPSLAEENCIVDAGTMTLNLKNRYDWSEGNLEAPMIAKVLSGTPLSFTNMCGLLYVEYTSIPDDAAQLKVMTPGYETTSALPVIGWDGSFTSDKPYLQARSGSTGLVKVDFTSGSSSEKAFYVPLPVGPGAEHLYPTVYVCLANSAGTAIPGTVRTATNLNIERSTIKPMPSVGVPSQYSVTTIIGKKNRANAAASKAGGSYSEAILGCPRGMGWINPGHTAFILDQNQSVRIWDLDAKTISEPYPFGSSSSVPF